MACKYTKHQAIKPKDSPRLMLESENRHLEYSFGIWKSKIDSSENWVRLNSLLILNSYFEQYFYETITLALANRPSLILGDMNTINGVMFLKQGISIPQLNQIAEQMTKGGWHKRYSLFRNTFNLNILSDLEINKLDEIRNIRNQIAHRFGKKFKSDYILFFDREEQIHISEKRMLSYLQFIEQTALKIDSNIINYIGNFELLILWHNRDVRLAPKPGQVALV